MGARSAEKSEGIMGSNAFDPNIITWYTTRIRSSVLFLIRCSFIPAGAGYPFLKEGEILNYLVGSGEMKECDRVTIEEYGMPSVVLMERAALAVIQHLLEGDFCTRRVLVICGSGNNGGDGFAVARLLHLRKIATDVLFAGKEESLTEDARIQKNICEKYGINIGKNLNVMEYTCIVDAIFGVGLSREITGHYRTLIEEINAAEAEVLSVDIPSGISADTGKVMGVAVRAKKTVTFAFEKTGQILYPGAQYCGELAVCDIGITKESFHGSLPHTYYMERKDLYLLPERRSYSNKGTYGKALLMAGQKNMCGAALLAGEGALRTGVGLLQICTEECNRSVIQTRLPESILTTWIPPQFPENTEKLISWPSAVGIGPGFGSGDGKGEFLYRLLSGCDCPVVLDADALNLISTRKEILKIHRQPVVVTPHIGEMARLSGVTREVILNDLMETCRSFAREYGVICVLKDTRTIISDGNEICINRTGTDGMAKGGSGDVLTGMITGLLAQGMEPFMAAKLAVWIHGKAGELASVKLGRRSMLSGDLLEALPQILREEGRDV